MTTSHNTIKCKRCGGDTRDNYEYCNVCGIRMDAPITATRPQDVLVIELTHEQCSIIHRLIDHFNCYNKESVFYKNHKEDLELIDNKMIAGFNCQFCGDNLCHCKCLIQKGQRHEIEK